MRGSGWPEERLDPCLWQRADMRVALASRDIAAAFRLLQRMGVSQRRIAALTGQSQSEISEILGGRHVVSYDVLARIAEGLEVPRGQLGLAYDEPTATLIGAQPGSSEVEGTGVLGRLRGMTLDSAPVDPPAWTEPVSTSTSVDPRAPVPDHVGLVDVNRLEAITAQLRALDYERGGGAARDAAVAQLGWAQQLLRAQVGDNASRALHLAVADLHILAGWTAFDIGMVGTSRRHLARAVEHGRFVNEPSLVARALYALGRVHLHHGWNGQALRLFQLGQVTAQQSSSGRAVAMIHANLAWAQAVLGESQQVQASIDRAREEFVRAEDEESPPWLRFFDSAELHALRGISLAYLPKPTAADRAEAIQQFTLSTTLREESMARSRALELIALAWLLIDEGALPEALRAGNEALDLAEQIRSQRVLDRLAPLRTRLARQLTHGDVRDLAGRVENLRSRQSTTTTSSDATPRE